MRAPGALLGYGWIARQPLRHSRKNIRMRNLAAVPSGKMPRIAGNRIDSLQVVLREPRLVSDVAQCFIAHIGGKVNPRGGDQVVNTQVDCDPTGRKG